MRSARGFTLFELLVVMALLAVATVLATGGFEPMLRTARERTWIERLQAELIGARSRARASGKISVVSFVPERREIHFETGSRARTLALPAGFQFDTGLNAATGAVDPSVNETLLFFPDGTASGFEIRVISTDRRAARVRVGGMTGKIELFPWEQLPEGAEPPS